MADRILALASGNKHKLEEFGEILAPLGWRVESIRRWLPDLPEPEETEPDLPGNARLKLSFSIDRLRDAALPDAELPDAVAADDSGLVVPLLDGAPGVFSARFAELAGRGFGDQANRAELSRRLALAGIREPDTTPASFACAIAFLDLRDGRALDAWAECEGRVGTVERGSSGFGYDPLFFPLLPGRILSDLTFAQMPAREKHGLSHRGKALARLAAILPDAPCG